MSQHQCLRRREEQRQTGGWDCGGDIHIATRKYMSVNAEREREREREREISWFWCQDTAYLNSYSSHSNSCSLLLHNGHAESVFILFCLCALIYFNLSKFYNTLCLDNVVRLAEVSARIYLLDTAGPRFWCWEYTLPLLSQELLPLLQWIS